MITFKSFVTEDLKWQESLSTRLFQVSTASSIGFEAFWMPLSSSIMRRIWPKEVRATVFHVTDDLGYEKVKKLQNKKASISSFFEMRGSYMEQGVGTKGGVLLELDANILGAFNQDMMSAPDRSGRRYVQLTFLKGRFGFEDLSRYTNGLKDLVGKLLKKYWPKVMKGASAPKTQPGRYYIDWMNLGMSARENDKKTLNLIIKDYLDGVEAIYKKNAKHLRGLLTDYMKLRRTEEAWDEIIVNNFKIKKVWLMRYSKTWVGDTTDYVNAELARMVGKDPEEEGYDVKDLENKMEAFMAKVKKDGFPVESGDMQDLEIYTRKIAKKESGQ